jgi:hypothetical protein
LNTTLFVFVLGSIRKEEWELARRSYRQAIGSVIVCRYFFGRLS